MKRKLFTLLAAISLLLCVAVLAYMRSHKVQSRLESAVASGAPSFDFAADEAFAWDRMYVFGCYSTLSLDETSLGFKWPDFDKTSIEMSDSVVLVVFVKQSSVVYWYEQPRSIELGGLANGKGYARSEAKFTIVRTSDRPELKPTTQPGRSEQAR